MGGWSGAGLGMRSHAGRGIAGALAREGASVVVAAFWAMQAALPEFEKRGTGRVINLCSLNGVNAHMYSVPYNAAKGRVGDPFEDIGPVATFLASEASRYLTGNTLFGAPPRTCSGGMG
ncbi:SDR family NAD(P)-dependent oxidoreductase [Dietzia sp. ANT_WB102]|nr:SDR family NAD(P)-dependent oxidoreductase [Dietzia sp. ANT_WB102]